MLSLILAASLLGQCDKCKSEHPAPTVYKLTVVETQQVPVYAWVPVQTPCPKADKEDKKEQPTATFNSTITITPAVPVVVSPAKPPKTVYAVVPGAPLTGYQYSEEVRVPGGVFTRHESLGPAPLVEMKRGLLGKYKLVK